MDTGSGEERKGKNSTKNKDWSDRGRLWQHLIGKLEVGVQGQQSARMKPEAILAVDRRMSTVKAGGKWASGRYWTSRADLVDGEVRTVSQTRR